MADLSEAILKFLNNNPGDPVESLTLSDYFKEDHQKIVGAIKSLQALGNIINAELKTNKCWELTEEGREVVEKGSHEAVLFYAIPENGILQSELMTTIPHAKVGFSKAMSSGWIELNKNAEGGPRIFRKVKEIDDLVQKTLRNIRDHKESNISDGQKQEFKKRKLLQEVLVKSYLISRGKDFTITILKQETDLTPEMITSDSWKEKHFKTYNFDAMGIPPVCGHLHPLMKVRTQFRQIFLEMGFTEMPTNNFIESSFWNFDALFQPQQHPARDAHDTFFVSDPQFANDFPKDYVEKVKRMHEEGGFGSKGYEYDWKLEEAKKNLLRTHTTAVSARMLYKLAHQETFTPVKYFSIDRVFRNETLDATHLAEFHQIEGVIADYGLTLGNLIGVLYEFFKKLGITKLRFKPAYNPYTEPSMEIFSYHEGLKKWVEIGNSGIFRPEMLMPMGLPEEVKVIAWGLSLERPTMIKYHIDNIRDLVGHKVNLQMVHDNAICRLDKSDIVTGVQPDKEVQNLEKRQEEILKRLQNIWTEIQKMQKRLGSTSSAGNGLSTSNQLSKPVCYPNITIVANPYQPLWSLLVLHSLLAEQLSILVNVKVHENVSNSCGKLQGFLQNGTCHSYGNDEYHFVIDLVWENIGLDAILYVDKGRNYIPIVGEINVARYLARHLSLSYEDDVLAATLIDNWLEVIHVSVIHGNNKERAAALRSLNAHLGSQTWLVGKNHSLADIVMWSALHQTQGVESAPIHVQKWLKACQSLSYYQYAYQFIQKYY